MAWLYQGEHSVKFYDNMHDEIDTWTDWFLVPTTRPVINPPGLKTNMVDIPGGNGSIDLTEVLTGFPTYSDRSGQLEFIVDNDFIYRYGSFAELYTEIMMYLHGKRLQMWLTDDDQYYYQGRFVVNEWKSEKDWSKITINYQLEPFKYEWESSEDNWLWDPFNLETGVIRYYPPTEVSGSALARIPGRAAAPVCPIIHVENSSGLTMSWGGRTFPLHNGDNVIPAMLIYSDAETVSFSGNGEVSLLYRGALL